MSWLLPILAVVLGAAFYALWARREGLLALQSYQRGQLAELSATLGNLQEAVLVVDAENFVLLANQALRGIFADAETLVGTRLDSERHGQALLDYLEAVRLRQPTPRRRIEFCEPRSQNVFIGEPERGAGRLAGGSPTNAGGRTSSSVWAEVAGTLMPPLSGRVGEEAWVLVVLHDITQQHKLETLRKEFVANVSHELRTPLSVIMGYVETLVDGHRTISEETREAFLLKIQRHTQRLNALLDDLLSLSRLESEEGQGAGRLGEARAVRERVDLGKLIASVVEDYRGRPAVVAGRFRLRTETGGECDCLLVWGDALQLTRALENLIDNALNYTPSGSEICVSARRQRVKVAGASEPGTIDANRVASSEQVEVCVRDNGPGIPAEDLPHIFERFYRVDKGRSRAQGGTGLGLSIVKHIVQLHGGRVRAESERGKGTAIYFTLPVT